MPFASWLVLLLCCLASLLSRWFLRWNHRRCVRQLVGKDSGPPGVFPMSNHRDTASFRSSINPQPARPKLAETAIRTSATRAQARIDILLIGPPSALAWGSSWGGTGAVSARLMAALPTRLTLAACELKHHTNASSSLQTPPSRPLASARGRASPRRGMGDDFEDRL